MADTMTPRRKRRKTEPLVQVGDCHCDLALRSESCLSSAKEAGYDVCAIEERVSLKKVLVFPERVSRSECKRSGALKRLTIVLDSQII